VAVAQYDAVVVVRRRACVRVQCRNEIQAQSNATPGAALILRTGERKKQNGGGYSGQQ